MNKRVKGQRWMVSIVGLLVAEAGLPFIVLYSHGDFGFLPILLLLYSTTGFLQLAVTRVRGGPVKWKSLRLPGAGAVVGLALTFAMHHQSELRYLVVGCLKLLLPLIYLLDVFRSRFGIVRWRPLIDGTKLRLSEFDLPRVTLSWTPGLTDLSLNDLPKGRVVVGADVAPVLRLASGAAWKGGLARLVVALSTITENMAYNLLSTVGGLSGLLQALEGFRRDSDGRVLIADLPMVYLVALDLALSDQGVGSGPDTLREKALEAAAVADEAEELDRR